MAVYIRGLAFKCKSGSRRESVLNRMKTEDEASTDLWLLKYAAVFAVAFSLGGWIGSLYPMI